MARGAKTASVVAPAIPGIGMLGAAVVAGALVMGSATASAQTKGVVRAFSYHSVPAGATIAVTPWDDSDEGLSVKAAFEHALRETGRTVDEDGVLELRFGLEVRRLGPEAPEPSLGRAGTNAEDGIFAQFNVWSTTEDSLLGGIRRGGRRVTVIQVTASLHETAGQGRVLWRGEAQTALGNLTRAEAAAGLAAPIAARLGERLVGTTVTLSP